MSVTFVPPDCALSSIAFWLETRSSLDSDHGQTQKKQGNNWRYFKFCANFVSRFFRYSLKKQGNFRRYFNFLPVNTNANTKADTSENARKYKCKYKLTILPVNTHVNTGKSRGKPLGKSLGKSLGRSLQKGYHGF